MQSSEEDDLFFVNFVDCDEWKRREGNLSRAVNATRAADVWKRFQRADALHYRLCYASRGLRTVFCDEIADPFKPRELDHDANLYATFCQEEARLRDDHPDFEVRRVVLEQDLKREYQEFLQDHNRVRTDTDGRPDRTADEIRGWAREHDLPYFDGPKRTSRRPRSRHVHPVRTQSSSGMRPRGAL